MQVNIETRVGSRWRGRQSDVKLNVLVLGVGLEPINPSVRNISVLV